MSSKSEKDRAKQIQDKCQSLLTTMLRDEDNKYCVDCDSKGPRWASWNLGVFLCIRCAGIHRNLGVHISRVKSVTLDTWTPEQVVSLQQMGNSRARAVYEALLPDGFRRPQTDSSLEAFVRAKYEQKKYLAREWVQPPTPKVDWDKEIDEELEKQKKKKKTNTNKIPTVVANPKPETIPQLLPKPNAKLSSSPVSTRTSDRTKSVNADLLGLDTKCAFSEDFSGFLSAEPNKIDPKPIEKTDTLKAEEDNFFNQPVPSEKEKAKLTKDSILALYDTAPINNAQLLPNSMTFNNYSVPVGASKNSFQQYQNQHQLPPQQPFNAFQQVMPTHTQLHNTVPLVQNTNMSYAQFNPVNSQQSSSNFGNNQFLQNNSGLVQGFSQNNGMHLNNGIHSSVGNGFVKPDQSFGQTNQYLGLTQQFGNMGMDSQNQFNSTSNIWQ